MCFSAESNAKSHAAKLRLQIETVRVELHWEEVCVPRDHANHGKRERVQVVSMR